MTSTSEPRDLIISADRVPVAAYQAIYHKLTGRVENINKKYPGSYYVTFDVIENLFHKLDQTIRQYHVEGSKCEFTISTASGDNYRFTSFERVKFANLRSLNTATNAFGLEYDFLIVLPTETENSNDIAQRYRVLISVEEQSRIRQRQVGRSVLGIQLHDPGFPTGSMTISYTDYAVGRTLSTVVDEWFSEISFVDDCTLKESVLRKVESAGNWLVVLLPLSVIVASIIYEPPTYPSYMTPIRYLLATLLCTVVGIIIAAWLSDKVDKSVEVLRSNTRFDLSGGDRRRSETLIKSRKWAFKVLGFVFVGFMFAAALGVGVNYVSAKWFGA